MSIPWIFNAAAMAAFSFSKTYSEAVFPLTLLVIFLPGFLIGMVNGACVAYLGIPSNVCSELADEVCKLADYQAMKNGLQITAPMEHQLVLDAIKERNEDQAAFEPK